MKRLHNWLTCLLFFSLPVTMYSQDSVRTKYNIYVIRQKAGYLHTTSGNSQKLLVDLKQFIPTIKFDLRYATTNNFMQRKLYPPVTTAYMRRAAAEKLLLVQDSLNKIGLSMKIFDAYRPYAVTEKMWELIHDERYVADPSKGSGHNRGVAVDLTIVDIKTGKELDMGTGFDNFTDTAHHAFTDLSEAVLKNRQLLKGIMEQNGFVPMATEWWHYYLPKPERFEVLDLGFETIRSLLK